MDVFKGSIESRLRKVLCDLETNPKPYFVPWGTVVKTYQKYYPMCKNPPSSIRKALKLPMFILTRRGWRVRYEGRIVPYEESLTGLVIITADNIHTMSPSNGARIIAKEYDPCTQTAFGRNFKFTDREIFKLFEVTDVSRSESTT